MLLRAQYNASAELLDHLLHDAFECPPECRDGGQELVDFVDDFMMTTVQNAAHTVLGSYNVAELKNTDDRLVDALAYMKPEDSARKLYKRTRKKARRPVYSRVDSLTAVEDVEQYYSAHFAAQNCSPPVVHRTSTSENDPALNALLNFFKKADIERVIRSYPAWKSPGADSVDCNILICLLKSSFLEHLRLLYILCIKTGLVPNRWNTSITMPVPKKPGSRTINEFRPIALTELVRRFFEKLLFRWIMSSPVCGDLREFHFAQAGFRSGFSTLTHFIAVHDSTIRGLRVAAYIDITAAYDSVLHHRLMETLDSLGCPGVLHNLIMSMFLFCRTQVVVNGIRTDFVNISRGLFQGSVLSPWLFLVYINDLAYILNGQIPTEVPLGWFFADDIQLRGHSRAQIQRALDTCERWANANGMVFNLNKCGAQTSDDTRPDWTLQGEVVPETDSYRYLGFLCGGRALTSSRWRNDGLKQLKRYCASFRSTATHGRLQSNSK